MYFAIVALICALIFAAPFGLCFLAAATEHYSKCQVCRHHSLFVYTELVRNVKYDSVLFTERTEYRKCNYCHHRRLLRTSRRRVREWWDVPVTR